VPVRLLGASSRCADSAAYLRNCQAPPGAGRALAGLGYDEVRQPNAIRPGDELDLESMVLEKRESKSRPDTGILRSQIYPRNQKRETVFQRVSRVLVARRPEAKATT